MSRNNQGGGNDDGGGRGPWGQGPQRGGPQPPNLEELLRKGQDRFRGALPGGQWGVKGVALVVLVLIAAWMATGFYQVKPEEVGVVLRFGKFSAQTTPGLNYHWPSPIETALTPKVLSVNRVDVGFRSAGELGRSRGSGAVRDIPEESLMLTGDENIVDVDFAVFWRIKNASDFLFKLQQPESTVKAVAESVMREVVGSSRIDDVLTEGRGRVESDTMKLMQKTLDDYQAGIQITQVKLQAADPPAEVIDSYRDVQAARADQERMRNEAQSYANDIIPRARGEAEQIKLQAEGYREQTVAEAEGDVARYLAIYNEYALAKEVTRKRLYLETMESVLSGMNKIVIDSKKGQGVVPYLPLPEVQRRAQESKEGQN
jgi:membrane protease subunit HflK